MRKKLGFFILFFVTTLVSQAQGLGGLKSLLSEDSISSKESYATIGLVVGSSGIGFEVKRKVYEDVVLRLGFSTLPINFTKYEQLGSVTVKGYYNAKFTNIHLLADYSLLKKESYEFRLTGGLTYFAKAQIEANVTPVGNYYYGEIQLNDGTMGDATINVDWKGIAPYVGFGLGSAIPLTKMNITLDVGTYYFLANAKVDMKTTGYLIGNETQRKQIQDNLKPYKWLPTFQLSLNYKL